MDSKLGIRPHFVIIAGDHPTAPADCAARGTADHASSDSDPGWTDNYLPARTDSHSAGHDQPGTGRTDHPTTDVRWV